MKPDSPHDWVETGKRVILPSTATRVGTHEVQWVCTRCRAVGTAFARDGREKYTDYPWKPTEARSAVSGRLVWEAGGCSVLTLIRDVHGA